MSFDITKYDDHLIRNYILDNDIDNKYPIRFVGSTRGHIRVASKDDLTIVNAVLYEDSVDVYDKDKAIKILHSFIGTKLKL